MWERFHSFPCTCADSSYSNMKRSLWVRMVSRPCVYILSIGSVSHVRDSTRKSLCAIPYYVIQTQCHERTLRQNAASLSTKHVTSFFKTSSVQTISGYIISKSRDILTDPMVAKRSCEFESQEFMSVDGLVSISYDFFGNIQGWIQDLSKLVCVVRKSELKRPCELEICLKL